MQGQTPEGGQATPPPATAAARPTSSMGLGTILGAVALVVALVAVAIGFTHTGATGAAGAPGSIGPQGPTGPQGPPSGVFWATVDSNGSLVYGGGAVSSELLPFTGEYQVNFTQNVSGCGFTATLGLAFSEYSSPAGLVTVAGRAGVPDAVYVATSSTTGTAEDLGFDLVVACENVPWAVVSSTGAVVRGTDVVSAAPTHTANGHYQVVFNQDVTNCSFFATLGTTGSTGAVAQGVATVAGRAGNPYAVFVATYNATGVNTNSSFHLLVMCGSSYWEVVSSTGGLVRGSATLATGTNSYDVGFATDIQNCAYIATAGETSSGVLPATIVTVVGTLGAPDEIYVVTYDSGGAMAAEPFHIAVFC